MTPIFLYLNKYFNFIKNIKYLFYFYLKKIIFTQLLKYSGKILSVFYFNMIKDCGNGQTLRGLSVVNWQNHEPSRGWSWIHSPEAKIRKKK